MKTRPEQGTGEEIALGDLIANSASAMQQLSWRADALDEAVGDWLEAGDGAPPPADLLQSVDLLRQSVACFSIMLGNLSRQPMPGHQVSGTEVTKGVFLRDIRDTCLGQSNGTQN